MNRILTTAVVGLAVLAGCASRAPAGDPIVDMKGVDPVSYQNDLADCRQYAGQVDVGRDAATGAVTGAVIGGVAGAVARDSDTAKRAAGVGAVLGGARGTLSGFDERERVVHNCLRNRGYAVLN